MKLQEIIPGVMEPKRWPLVQTYVRENLEEFKAVLASCPVKNQVGALSTCEAFWLYCLVRDLAPKVVVESGSLYGFSLWFLEAAVAGNGAVIYSFDPGKYEVEQRSDHVFYRKTDWTEHFPSTASGETNHVLPPGSLVFFDDHQDQAVRLTQARERGVAHAVFHDNYESLEHSHVPIRYCALLNVAFMHVFECLREDIDPVFGVGANAQTYRWLTWLKLEG